MKAKNFEDEILKDKIGRNLFEKLDAKNQICVMDLDRANFDDMCFDINEILVERDFFLRVYQRKDKFRYIFHKTEEKTDKIKSLSTCLMIKFNGFNVLCPYLETKQKKDLKPIDIIYEPVRSQDAVINFFFKKCTICLYGKNTKIRYFYR